MAAPERRAEPERRVEGARPQEHGVAPERRVEPATRGRTEIVQQNHDDRRWGYHSEGHDSFYWSGFHPGIGVGVLPSGYLAINTGSASYYYYQGVYYQSGPSGYAVVAPPIGAAAGRQPGAPHW